MTPLLIALAVCFYSTGDTSFHATAPTDAGMSNCWSLVGTWGPYTGVPVAPHWFLAAKHVGQAGGTNFTFQGSGYMVDKGTNDFTDLTLWHTVGAFPVYAAITTNVEATNQLALLIGRGTQRGTAIVGTQCSATNGIPVTPAPSFSGTIAGKLVTPAPDVLKGWNNGTADHALRWGTNTFTGIVTGLGSVINFNRLTSATTGDSSGGTFSLDASGNWTLAGVISDSDGPVFNYQGYTVSCGTSHQQSQVVYASIWYRLSWVQSVISQP